MPHKKEEQPGKAAAKQQADEFRNSVSISLFDSETF